MGQMAATAGQRGRDYSGMGHATDVGGTVFVPFSVSDFIDRAVQVYGERVGVVDEPDQPAASLGDLTYAELGVLARRQAAHLDDLGVGAGDRVAVVSHNSARLMSSFFGVAGYGRVLVPV